MSHLPASLFYTTRGQLPRPPDHLGYFLETPCVPALLCSSSCHWLLLLEPHFIRGTSDCSNERKPIYAALEAIFCISILLQQTLATKALPGTGSIRFLGRKQEDLLSSSSDSRGAESSPGGSGDTRRRSPRCVSLPRRCRPSVWVLTRPEEQSLHPNRRPVTV